MAKAATVWVDVRADTSAFARDLSARAQEATRSLGGIASAGASRVLGDIGQAAGVAALAVGGVGIAALGASANFDKAMSAVNSVANATATELDALRESALDAGAETVFSASEAAQAQAELARAGVAVTDILGGGLSGALGLAAAGQLELAEAANITAQALNIFDLGGDQATRVADVLAAGANKSAADVQQLGQSLQQSGLVAAQLGIGLEDTVGALSLFADNALIGSDAGTSFKTMLQRLVPQSEEQAKAMDALGLSFFDAQGNFVGLEETAARLNEALGGLNQEQRTSALTTIFGSDAIRAATLIYDAGAQGVAEYTAAVDDQGAAARMASTMLDNLAGDVEEFTGATETALIRIGDLFQSSARGIVQGATTTVNAFNEFATTPAWARVEANAERIGTSITAALGSVGESLSDALGGIDAADVDRAFGVAEDAVADFTQAAKGLEGVLAGVGIALGSQLLGQLPLIGQFLPAFSPVTGLLVGIVAGSEDARDAFGSLASEFGSVAREVGPGVLRALSALAQELGSGLAVVLDEVGGAAADAARALGPVLAGAVEDLAPILGDIVTAAGELVGALADGLVPVLDTALGPVLDVAVGLLGVAAGALGVLADNAWLVVPALSALVAFKLVDVLSGWGSALSTVAQTAGGMRDAISQIAATRNVSQLTALGGVLRSTARETASMVGGLVAANGPMIALTAAVTLGAFAFQRYADEQNRAKQNARDLVDAIKSTREEFERLNAEEVRQSLVDKGVLDTQTRLGVSLRDLRGIASEFGDDLGSLDDRFQQARGSTERFENQIKGLPGPVRDLAMSIVELRDNGDISTDEVVRFFDALEQIAKDTEAGFRGAKDELRSIAQEANAAGDITDTQLRRVLDLIANAKTPDDLNAAFAELTGLLGDTGTAAQQAADEVRRLVDELERLNNVERDVDEASRRLAESADRVAESFREGGAGLDERSAAGRRNASAIASQVEAAEALAEAQALVDATGETSRQTLQRQADALRALYEQGLITGEEFLRLIDIYNLTPEEIETTVTAYTAEAEAAVVDITNQLNAIPGGPTTDPIKAEVQAALLQGDYDVARARLLELERVYVATVRVDVAAADASRAGLGIVAGTLELARGVDLNGNGRIGFNSGGLVPGFGSRDTVPAMLTPGEFVLRQDAVDAVGLDRLQSMNAAGRDPGDVWFRALVGEVQMLRRDLATVKAGGQVVNQTIIEARNARATAQESARAMRRAR